MSGISELDVKYVTDFRIRRGGRGQKWLKILFWANERW